MLKTKSKVFKPKGPSRPRTAAPSREDTVEPIVAAKETTPSTKRKEREEDDTTSEPPAKRVPIPSNPTIIIDEEEQQPSGRAKENAPGSTPHPLPTPAPTPVEIDSVAPTPRISPITSPKLTRKQFPSLPASNNTQDVSSTPALKPPSVPPPAHPQQLTQEQPSTADEVPSQSTLTASSGSAGGAILSKPTPNLSASRTSPPPANASLPPAHPAPSANLGAAGSSAIPPSLAISTPIGFGAAGGSINTSSTGQNATGASLGPAGGSVIVNARNLVAGGSMIIAPAQASASALGRAGDIGEESDAGPSRASQVVPMAALNPDGTPGGIIEAPVKKKKKAVRRKQAKAATDDDRATIEMPVGKPRHKKGTAAAAKKKEKRKKKEKPGRKKREDTPESAEDEIVDPSVLTMSELCVDLRIGKKFSRHDDIKGRIQKQKELVKAARLARLNPDAAEGEQAAGEEGDEGGPAAEGENAPDEQAPEEEEPEIVAQSQGILMRIVDGQIVVDDRSTQLDRHLQAQGQEGVTEVIEENDFTKITTSGTYMKKEPKNNWDFAAMDMFYKGLRTFGTDFGMIANMFPHRSRKQIKLRFNKEERENPERIKRALAAPPLPLDFNEYEELGRNKYVEVEEIQAELQAVEDEHNATKAANEAELNASIQKKKDAIARAAGKPNAAKDFFDNISDDEDGHASSAKENRGPSTSRSREPSASASGRKKKGKGKAKEGNKHSIRAGGEEFEIVATD